MYGKYMPEDNRCFASIKSLSPKAPVEAMLSEYPLVAAVRCR